MERRATGHSTDIDDGATIRCLTCGTGWQTDRGFVRAEVSGRPWGWRCTRCSPKPA